MKKTLITIDGHIGSGALDVGKRVARILGWRYFDRIRLQTVDDGNRATELAIGDAVPQVDFSDKMWAWIERAASYFAIGAAGDDPLLQGAADIHLPLTWDRSGPTTASHPDSSRDITELARDGESVIVHRAGAVELANNLEVARIGIFADWDDRVDRIAGRAGLDACAAENRLNDFEQLQRAYFRDFHNADPEDPSIYDFIVNTSKQNINIAALDVTRFVNSAHHDAASTDELARV